jgi:hypothetical protein
MDGAALTAPFLVQPALGEAAGSVRLAFAGEDATYTLCPGHVDDLVGALKSAVARWDAKPPTLLAGVRVGAVSAVDSAGAARSLCVDVEASGLGDDPAQVALFCAYDPANCDTWYLTANEARELASVIERAGGAAGPAGALGSAESWLRVAADGGATVLTFDDEMVRERWGDAFSLRLDVDGGKLLRDLLERASERARSTPAGPASTGPERIADLAWDGSDPETGSR